MVANGNYQDRKRRRDRNRARVGIVLAVLILLAVVAIVWRELGEQAAPEPLTPPPAASASLLRVTGSNTVGSELAPELAEAFLRGKGAPDVQRTSTPELVTVTGTLPEAAEPTRIEIRSGGTETAFDALAAGAADVGMASRRITADEAAELATRGDLTAREAEHVLALDAVAVIVRPDAGVAALSLDQLRGVFTCELTDWSQLGAPAGPIRVLARDENSGTYETVRDTVLGGTPLCATAERFEDSQELSRAVAEDPRAIGFVGLSFVGGNTALELFEGSTVPTAPDALSVSTESYLLSRRLYFYVPTQPDNPLAREFADTFALSEAGQRLVAENAFVSPLFAPPTPPAPECDAAAPPGYCAAVGGRERVPFDVRFDSGTDQLDNRAYRNLDLFAASLTAPQNAQVLLVGFADNAGTDEANLALSRARADTVLAYLASRGVTGGVLVEGFGEALPVDTNDTPEGREQNRRVEVWRN